MPSDEQEMAKGMRLAAVAVVSAIVTATAVIGAGQFWISKSADMGPSDPSLLIRTAG